ncbi:MAG: bifunctional tetrahydrofolate synthase/dihydrofolate synthase [Betaproteobacteria bacterium]|jgi:dihydrofolate synthase/folylpolyglutamate synthase|nr:bifunctional tetrahydrofolate synthase/dihydrofolate synthase [Betaproteobacteria bacterium]
MQSIRPTRHTSLQGWLEYIERLHAQAIDLGLERVQLVKRALGIEQVVPVITVGGTNGKGSICAMLERILLCAGYRVGLYTSPHLIDYNERVRIAGSPASDAMLCESFSQVEAARGDTQLTYFEFGTLAAWQAFSTAGVEAVILEVGLGGRLDAVNAFDADCAIVAAVDIDHKEYLGETREAIGFEKAGIFRQGRPAIVGDAQPPQSLLEHAGSIGAGLRVLGKDFGYTAGQGQWIYWGRRGRRGGLAYPALRGAIQLANASTAIAGLEAMAERLPVSMQDVRRGLIEVELPGRFQVLPGCPTVVLDVAHNPQAAGVLADNLGSMAYHPNTWAVFGMLSDKDIAGVVECLKGRIDRWFAATLSGPRGTTAEMLASTLADHGIRAVACFDSPAEAYRAAREQAGENDRILAFGSFLTVASVLRAIDDERKRRTT